jgi:hypothetical protein
MTLEYGVLDPADVTLTRHELLPAIRKSLANFSYDFSAPPDFRGLFSFLVRSFSDCDDLDLLQSLIEILSSIAGYKLGICIADIFTQVTPIVFRLLGSGSVPHIKVSVDYFRRIARAIGPRLVLARFVAANSNCQSIQRGLAIIAYQLVVDNPEFRFAESDFGDWTAPLYAIPDVGDRLREVVQRGGPSRAFRPPSVPRCQMPKLAENDEIEKHVPQTQRARRPKPPYFPQQSFSSIETSVISRLTPRQQSVREFVDTPFTAEEKMGLVVSRTRSGMTSSDWEERCTSYWTMKRLLRYSADVLTDDDVHVFVTAFIDDVGGSQTALVLAALGALEEAFRCKPAAMEFELGRVVPPMLPLHQKTAQFFEAALSQCFAAMMQTMTVKRFLSVMVANGDVRGTKVQAAIARCLQGSLEKKKDTGEKIFARSSDEVVDLVRLVSKLAGGAATETRAAAARAAKLLAEYYADQFPRIVQKALSTREAADLLSLT